MVTYTDLWSAAVRFAQLEGHQDQTAFWNSVNNKFKDLCDAKHMALKLLKSDGDQHTYQIEYDLSRTQPMVDELKRICGVT